jgi:hypothetical protein
VTGSHASASFRLAYVPGVTPGKWVRIWEERLPGVPLSLVQVPAADAPGVLRALDADAGFVRLPIDRTDLSAIPLYVETTVVVVPRDHLLTAADEVTPEDLAEETVLHPLDDTLDWEGPPGLPARERPPTTADAVALVAAGVGVLVVPQSLARLHHRRDVAYRPLTGVPASQVALSWREDTTTDLVEDFIGIVRGRTVNSSRGRAGASPGPAGAKPAAKGEGAQKPAKSAKGAAAKSPKSAKSGGRSGATPRAGAGGKRTAKGGAAKSTGRGRPRRRS